MRIADLDATPRRWECALAGLAATAAALVALGWALGRGSG